MKMKDFIYQKNCYLLKIIDTVIFSGLLCFSLIGQEVFEKPGKPDEIFYQQLSALKKPILINKIHADSIAGILNISKKILLENEVDKGNLYLWVSEDDLKDFKTYNLEYEELKIAMPAPNNQFQEPNSGGKGVIPDLDAPTYSGNPYVGSAITIYLTGRNASYVSWTNDAGYVSLTLPDFCNVSSFGGDSDWDGVTKAICGNSIWTCNGNQTSAVDVLIDGYEVGWSIWEARTIWATVTPTQTGALDIYSKISIGTLRDPSGGCQGPDQQYWPVYQHFINITVMPRPDLIVEDIWTVPSPPLTNQATSLWARIKNIGNAAANNITWRYYIDNVQAGTDTHSPLAPNETREESFDGYIFTTIGNHTFKVSVDPVTDETVTSNNSRTETINVTTSNVTPNPPAFITNGSLSIYPTKSYSIQIDYTDNNGASDLQNVYLRLAQNDNEGTNRLTMMWPLSGSVSQWADEAQALNGMTASKTTITNGYRVTWNFTMKWNWNENTNIDYWAYSTDDANAESSHTKQNQNAFYENDIRIYSSAENADPVTAGDNYTVSGQVTFEGTSNTPDDWTGINVEMRKTTVTGTLLNTDNTVSSGYSVIWATTSSDIGTQNVYIVPKNTNHQPPNDSDTYWDLENVTINPDLIETRIKDNDIFIDKTAKYGIPILLEAKLQYYQTLLWWDLNGQTVNFEIYYSGSWHTIPDDGISSTSFITSSGIASVYYTAPSSLSEGNYSIRAKYNGNGTYASCELQKILNIHKPQWLYMVYICGDNNLEGNGCIDYFEEMCQADDNNNVSVVVLFDRISGYSSYSPDWTTAYYMRVCLNNVSIINDWSEVNMGLTTTLNNFITTATNECSAENKAIILWNHGSGWVNQVQTSLSETPILIEQVREGPDIKPMQMPGPDSNNRSVCYDETDGDHLTLSEIRTVLDNYSSGFEIIGFDACVMGSVEVGYELRNLGDFYIGSEENEGADGWEYQNILTSAHLTATTTPAELAQTTVNASIGSSNCSILGSWNIGNSEFDNLSNEIKDLAIELINDITIGNTKTIITNARANSTKFAAFSGGPEIYMDLREFAIYIANNSTITALQNKANLVANRLVNSNFRQAFNKTTSMPTNVCGLSIYFPPNKSGSEWSDYLNNNIILFTANTIQKWDDFLNIYLDNNPPIRSVILPNSGGWFNGNISCMAAADDPESDILYVEFQYSLNNSTWYPLPGSDSPDGKDWYGDNGWGLTFQTTNTPVHGTINDNSVWIRVRASDIAGNISSWDPCDASFGVDNALPTGTILIDGGLATTIFNIVNLTLTYNDNLSGVTHMRFSNNGSIWSDWQTAATSINWNLFNYGGNTSYGMKTVYARYKDAAQNESISYTDQIEYIIAAPLLGSFTINNGATQTSSPIVTLNNSATNSPTHYMASENSNFSGASWFTYSTAPSFTLSSGYGTKTVYFKVKNSTGESNVISDNIEYIQAIQPPVINYFAINNGTATTLSSSVILNNTATNSPTHYMASENSNFSGASWYTYSTAPGFTLSAGFGMKTVYFKVKNSAGTSNPSSDQIEYINDPVPQNLVLQYITIVNGSNVCYDATQTITVAGNGTTFTVQNGGSATMIAGQNIQMFPGTTISSGGYLYGYISTNGIYCGANQNAMVSTEPIEREDDSEINGSGFTVYPNPTTGTFTLEIIGDEIDMQSLVRIYSMLGVEIIERQLLGVRKMEFSLEDRPPGMYIISVLLNGKIETTKIVKQ